MSDGEQANREVLWAEFRMLVVLLAVVAVAAVFVMASGVFLLAFGAVLLAVLLHDLTSGLTRRTPLSRGWALVLVLIGLTAALAGFVWHAGPNLAAQTGQVVELVPEALERVSTWVSEWFGNSQAIPLQQLLPPPQALLGSLPRIVTGTFGAMGSLAVLIVLGVYLANDPPRYRDGAVRLFKPEHRDEARGTLNRIGWVLRRWLRGQLIAALVMAITAYAVLRLLGVPLPLVLAVLTGLLEFVPYVGAIVAGIPVVLVATTESWSLAGYALLAFVGIQMLEGYLLVPLVQGEAIRVPPAVILFSQILMGVLFGVVGIVLATPLVAALSVIHERWYVDAVLAEPATED